MKRFCNYIRELEDLETHPIGQIISKAHRTSNIKPNWIVNNQIPNMGNTNWITVNCTIENHSPPKCKVYDDSLTKVLYESILCIDKIQIVKNKCDYG